MEASLSLGAPTLQPSALMKFAFLQSSTEVRLWPWYKKPSDKARGLSVHCHFKEDNCVQTLRPGGFALF